jgi:23S rRNA (guanosine2251-2'-O)-methyltransferase
MKRCRVRCARIFAPEIAKNAKTRVNNPQKGFPWSRIIESDRKQQLRVIPGFHAVRESLRDPAGKVREIWIAEGKRGARPDEVLRLAKDRRIPVSIRKQDEIERFAPGVNHQGILAFAEFFAYLDLESLVDGIRGGRGLRLILAADHITDEGNLGALIRTSAFFGAQGLILPKDRSAQITGKLLKRTSGAFAALAVAQVVNLRRALDTLRDRGFWIIGAAGEGAVSIYDFDWNRDTVLVLGSESKGISRSVRQGCDALVRIPGEGTVESLNVSVACGVILGEIRRRRQGGKP